MQGSAIGICEELKRWTKYRDSPWTVLPGISVALPVFNESVRVFPLAPWSQGGSLAYLSPQVVSLVATVGCLFTFVWTVGHLEQARQDQARQTVYQVGVSVMAALTALGLYLTLHYEIKHDLYYRVLGWDSEDTRRLAGDLVLLFSYALCFASMTRACAFACQEFRGGSDDSD